MKLLREHIIVKVKSVYLDQTKYKGVDGKPILINPFFEEKEGSPNTHLIYVRNHGEVVSVPSELLAMPISQEPIGYPSYHEDPPYTWKTTRDIAMEIQIGDRVYFHQNCLAPDPGQFYFNNYHLFSKKEMENGKEVTYHYFRVKYQLVFAAVRYEKCNNASDDFKWWMEDELKPVNLPMEENRFMHGDNLYRKTVTMIGSYCFIEPDMETWEDISIPTPEVLNGKVMIDTMGKPIMKPKDQWLVKKAKPGMIYLRGWIRYVGTPLHGDVQEVQEGMYVHFRPNANTLMSFEGKEYFRMIQRHIGAWEPEKSQLKTKFEYETV